MEHDCLRIPCTSGILTLEDLRGMRGILRLQLEQLRREERIYIEAGREITQEMLDWARSITRLDMKLELIIGTEERTCNLTQ